MKVYIFLLMVLTAALSSLSARADVSAAQTENVREAVFRTLLGRAKIIMPQARVFILEKETHYPPEWGNMNDFDPSPALIRRFAGASPHVIAISQSGGGASSTEEWHEEPETHAHGPLLKIVSLHRLSAMSVEVETDIDAGLPRPKISQPYLVDLQNGRWMVREDVTKEWWQAVHEGDVREAVVRDELAQGIYGLKPITGVCYLSFGAFGDALRIDPPDTFLERFTKDHMQLRRASQCPRASSGKTWVMIGVEHVRWISGTEAEVDGGGARSNWMSAESNLYKVTHTKNGWEARRLLSTSI